MVSVGWIQFTLIFSTYIAIVYPAKTRNGFCKIPHKSRDATGQCILFKNCPEARKNITLPVCYTKNEEIFVCCPSTEKIMTPIVDYTIVEQTTTRFAPFIENTTPITINPVNNINSDVAKRKCELYKHIILKRARITEYIFGGTQSLAKEFPHMAALGYGLPTQWLCGGSLISKQFVVTAAHCVTYNSFGDVNMVRLGDLDLQSNYDDASPQNFLVSQKFIHPEYKLPSQYNDIALLKLDHPAQFNEYVAPICLTTTNILPNTNFLATGWGQTELGGPLSNSLMKVNLDYFANNVCNVNYMTVSPASLPHGILDDRQICAGSFYEEKDTCQGDSGGPLQIRDNNVLYLVGITSFGRACGVPNRPGVYTRVSYYVPWIEQIVWPNY